MTDVLDLFTSWAGQHTGEETPACSVLFDQVNQSPVWTSEFETAELSVEPLGTAAGSFHPIYVVVKSCPTEFPAAIQSQDVTAGRLEGCIPNILL